MGCDKKQVDSRVWLWSERREMMCCLTSRDIQHGDERELDARHNDAPINFSTR